MDSDQQKEHKAEVDYLTQSYQRAYDVARRLAGGINDIGFDYEAFADSVTREHRTLQQQMFRAFLTCIAKWAEFLDSNTDLRNEATVKYSRMIVELLDREGELFATMKGKRLPVPFV
jgi:hypothetical protein